MCDWQWDALAEINLIDRDSGDGIYCLCSRVFVRNKEEKIKQVTYENDDSWSESEAIKEKTSTCSEIAKELQNDAELVSCYYSASHTDNLSTDEHDSVRESQATNSSSCGGGRSALLIKSLQSSDSGADLSEYLKNDLEASWQKYWASHGERIIWNSWISKYSDYINPQYFQGHDAVAASSADKEFIRELEEAKEDHEIVETKRTAHVQFTFDRKDVERYGESSSGDGVERPRRHQHFLVRELSGSDSCDKFNHGEVSEGWNPLSPLSIECEFEAERLITSRCGSHASSSLRTIDSLTNVTRMTVSSLDLSNDDSSNTTTTTTDSISSVSSAQSSLSSSSSEELDETQEYDRQWNVLWKSHYEEEYLKNYQQFLSGISNPDDVLIGADKQCLVAIKSVKATARRNKSVSDDNDLNSDAEIKRLHRRLASKGEEKRRAFDRISSMFGTLNVDDSNKRMDVEDSSDSSVDVGDDKAQMSSMGLPLAFGSSRTGCRQQKGQGKRPINETEVDDVSSNNRIRATFELLGIEMSEGKRPKLVGSVEYKMKHIRLQNRHLKFHKSKSDNPKHIRFDDDGNPLPADGEDENDQQSSSDNFNEMNHSSTDNEEFDPNRVSPLFKASQLAADESPQQGNNRKKKRKRKINFPPEIKENPKLRKYWQRRFSLFSKFDMGIKLDEESWYSVTPEIVAKHTAERCRSDVIVDAFCGAGGNSIQFAFTCQKVIAIDIDPKKIEIARNNARVYGVADRIEFVVGDFFRLADRLRADAVFLSPPWGGPSYLKQSNYDLEEFLRPAPLSALLASARKISQSVAIFLPKNSNTFALMKEAGPGRSVEIEQNFINKKLIAITAYYNELIKNVS